MFIKSVKYLDGFRLSVILDNNHTNIIDLTKFITDAQNPMITKYRNLSQFKKVTLKNGILSWNNLEMCINPDNVSKYIINNNLPI